MSLNDTPSGERLHIGFFGCRNAGKSSLVNAVTGQNLAVVSDTKGTTTDPVRKAMELLPLGPVVIIDTPGYDDEGELGALRVEKTKLILNTTDLAVLVTDASQPQDACCGELAAMLESRKIPFIRVYNKADLLTSKKPLQDNAVYVSAKTGEGVQQLKELMAHLTAPSGVTGKLAADLLQAGQTAVLVTPIDSAAPKGRLILPQQQVIRDVLEADGIAVVVKETQLTAALHRLQAPPAIVITDSQAFARVAAETPPEVPLTSFSVLMSRYKGTLEQSLQGVRAIAALKDGDTVLISEGCTHHRQCGDIGTQKLPCWLRQHTQKQLCIQNTSGAEFPEDLSPYKLVIHCGGCMLTERTMQYRAALAHAQGVPFTNYGTAIAYMNGILQRSITPLGYTL